MNQRDPILEEIKLLNIFNKVREEMHRASQIHGEKYNDVFHALTTISEEVLEVIQATSKGDKEHTKVEIIQAIGTLVKFYRNLDELMG